MKRFAFLLFTLLMVFSSAQEAQASHLMGVDITYTCLNSCTIRVELRAYRDCTGSSVISPNPFQFTPQTFGCGQPIALGGWSPQQTTEVTPLCSSAQTQCTNPLAQINGVQEYYWFRDYDICTQPNCIFTMSWTTCCRNPAITSLSGAGSQSIYVGSTTLNTNIPCNGSPQFSNPPVPYICAGQPYTFNQGATDPEGDSLVYSLGPCYNSSSTNQVTYNAGYSAAAPLGPTWTVGINSQTGDITVTPNPGNVVVGVLCVYVEEWRNINGVPTLINTIVRDIQMTVINCPANTLPAVTGITNPTGGTANGFVFNTCLGNSICFNLPVFDPDTSTQALTMWWDQNIPGGVFSQAGNPSVTDTISGNVGQSIGATFCWTPTTNGTFQFLVTVQDNACPLIGQNQFTVQIVVGDVQTNTLAANPGCGTVSLCAQPTSGSPPYTFVWTGNGGLSGNPNATDSCVTHTYPGSGTYSYVLEVTDANGCVGYDSGTVNIVVNVQAVAGPDISFCSGGSGTIGNAPLPNETYSWSPTTGLASPNASSTTVTLTNPGTTPQVTQYILTTTDLPTGCVSQDTVDVTVFPIPSSAFNLPSPTCVGDPVTISYTGFNGAGANYVWNFGGGAVPSTATGPGPHSVVFPNAGTQAVTLSVSENGCTSPLTTQNITVFPLPTSNFTASGPHCVNLPSSIVYTGSAGAGATYNWNFSGGTVVSGTGQGPYQVSWPAAGVYNVSLVVTQNGCTGDTTTVPVTITAPANPSSQVVDATCNGFTDGSIDLTLTGGSPAFTYQWTGPGGFSSTAQDISGLQTGNYSVVVTDQSGCVVNYSTNVGQPSALFATVSSVPALCFQSSDGSATVTVSGGTPGYTYIWDINANSQPTATATGLGAGTYTVTATDNQGCVITSSVQITQPSQVVVNATTTDVSCNSGSDGTASAAANGGAGSYTYTWSPGGLTGSTITGQLAGQYIVVATDGNGCTATDTVLIDEPAPLTATTQTTPNSCALPFDNGTAAVFATGGNGGYSYQWNDPNTQTTQQATGLAPGTYSVTVTDQLGCTFVTDAIVGQLQPPTVTAGAPSEFCEGEGGAIVNAFPSGGTPGYYFTWWCNLPNCGIDSINDNDPLVNPTTSTWYYVQVTDTNGCTSNVDSVFVTVLPKPIVDAGPDIFICGDSAPCVNINPIITNAAGPYTYNWFPSAGLNNSTILNPCARPDTTTIYTLVVTAGNGCTSDFTTTDTLSSVTVHVNPIPVAEAGPDQDICFGETAQLQGFATGAGPAYTFEWSPLSGLNNPTIANPLASPVLTTEYVLVTYSNGCPSYGDTVVVNVHTLPTANAGNDQETCLGGSVTLDAFADGDSTATYTYQWTPSLFLDNPNQQNPISTPEVSTVYTVVATSSWGCESPPENVLVTVLPTPIAEAGDNQTICLGNDVVLQGGYFYTTTDSADINDIFYTWTPTTNINDVGIPMPTVDPQVNTWYFLTVDAGICSTTDSVLVTVQPDVGLAVASDTNIACEGTPVQLNATAGLGGTGYTWSPAAGLDNPNSPNPIATPEQTTTYQVIGFEGGCADTLEITVEVIPGPKADYLSSLTEGCTPHTVSFIQTATDATNYIWNFGDGGDVSNEEQPIHVYDTPGNYNVSLTVVGIGGCSATIDDMQITVMDPPVAEFSSIEAYPVEMALPNTQVQFINESRDAVSYSWNFGDGVASAEMDPSHTFSMIGEYMVTLAVTNAIGCKDEVMHGPFVIFSPELFIPNVFTPNSDQINDRFIVEYTGSQPFNIQIFDRWGVLLYEATNKNEGWNGRTANGEDVTEGTYYYRVTIGDRDFAGNVTLVR